jgi:type I restriction enzyme S subunit
MCIAGANTGAVNIVPEWVEEANLTQTTARISVDEEVALPEYVHFILASSFVQNQISGWTRGSAQPGLNLGRVEKFKVPVPPKAEQERIVSRLESISTLVASEEESVDRLSRVKKGLMQDLLTGEVRTTDEAIEVLDEVEAHG